jgi:hypothetical protein
MKLLLSLISAFFLQTSVMLPDAPEPPKHMIPIEIKWQKLDTGLEQAEITLPHKSIVGDSRVTVMRVKPAYYKFQLLSKGEGDKIARTAKEWAQEKKLVAAVNAGQFRLTDGSTNMGYMKNYKYINNPQFRKVNNYDAVLAFNRKDASVPEIQIIDLKCQKWDDYKDKYHSFTQSISLIACNKQVVDNKQTGQWSMVLFGIDTSGNALLIFTRSPYTIRTLSDMLLQLPLSLKNLMYLEGGPEASLYLSANGKEIERMGSYETKVREDDTNTVFWSLPNVIGIVKK